MAPIRRWQVWSLDPKSGRWVVVDRTTFQVTSEAG